MPADFNGRPSMCIQLAILVNKKIYKSISEFLTKEEYTRNVKEILTEECCLSHVVVVAVLVFYQVKTVSGQAVRMFC